MYLGRVNGFNIRFKCISYNNILFRAQKYIDAAIKNKNSTKYITDSKKRTLMKINDILMESGFSPLSLKVDNPKGSWLEDKRKYSEENGRRPSGRLNILGSTTGWFNREAFIPVSLLKNIKGTNDEQKKVRQSDLDWLVNFMGEHGKLPDADWHEFNEYAPMIVIGQDGIPFVNEGNHRIMAADKLGFVALPVEIKYYNGGELEKGILSPDKVSEYDTKMRDAGVFYGRYKPENKAVNESGVDIKGLQDSLIEKYDLKSWNI